MSIVPSDFGNKHVFRITDFVRKLLFQSHKHRHHGQVLSYLSFAMYSV